LVDFQIIEILYVSKIILIVPELFPRAPPLFTTK